MRLLCLLRDASAAVPPPALDMWSETNSLRWLLYGKPWAHYSVQCSDNLSAAGWFTSTITNRNKEIITPLLFGHAGNRAAEHNDAQSRGDRQLLTYAAMC